MTTVIAKGGKSDEKGTASGKGTELWWGVIGAGRMAYQFAADLDEAPHSALGGVAGRNRERVEGFAAAYEDAVAYPSVEALIASPDIDVIYIATPNQTHSELAIRCLEAGKPVLVEKPFALSAAEAHCIAAAARATGTFCMEAMWTRFLPIFTHARRQVESGALGRIKMIRAELGFPIDYALEPTMSDPASGGGATLDLGVYTVSLAHMFLGAPRSVRATATFADTGVDEQMCASLTYDGAVASVAASHCSELTNSIAIYGTMGRLEIGPPLVGAIAAREVRYKAAPAGTPQTRAREGGLKRALKRSGAWPLARSLARKAMGKEGRKITRGFEGNGYRFEIDEVARCLAAGRRESEIMPLQASIDVMEILDQVRATWPRRG